MNIDKDRPAVNSIEIALGQLRDAIKRIHIDLPEQCSAVKRTHALVDRSPQRPAELLVIQSEPKLGKTQVLDLISGRIGSEYVQPVQGRTCLVTCRGVTDGSALGILLCRELKVAPIGLFNMPRLGQYITDQLRLRSPRLLVIDNTHSLMESGIVNAKALAVC